MANAKTLDGIHHVAIRVPDYDAAATFYTEALGLEQVLEWGEEAKRSALFHAGRGSYVEIFSGGSDDEKPDGHWLHLAFRSEDCDAALERARAAGAEVTMEPRDVPMESRPETTTFRIAFCKGPAGETIEFFQNDLT
ncbi:MAG: VOC family protein [Lentisphaerae bacterium]|jgi:glyoxylase I family protein|nr:VOC family protein [Lentisphaerota bacterium]MBT4818935.1 VOC family protein [Lentisphaerota bacterium]MBT5608231.1 VOC family protein [Lentisphaerota bacterium]MBT7058880.1 VOC family protein [Lentisphaerota bacterium]MBT7842889.1 VOC family protein [Lentisphaerota bacterium]